MFDITMVIAKLDTNFLFNFHDLYSLHDGKLIFVANLCESKVVRRRWSEVYFFLHKNFSTYKILNRSYLDV